MKLLRALDIVVGLKLICRPNIGQVNLALQLGLHQSQISTSIKVLLKSKLFFGEKRNLIPNYQAWEELLPTLKYFYPADLSGIAIGIPTSYGAPPLDSVISRNGDPVPVWASAHGKTKGLRMEPLIPGLPDALAAYPDPRFYEILTLVDAIRAGSTREQKYAKEILLGKLESLE